MRALREMWVAVCRRMLPRLFSPDFAARCVDDYDWWLLHPRLDASLLPPGDVARRRELLRAMLEADERRFFTSTRAAFAASSRYPTTRC